MSPQVHLCSILMAFACTFHHASCVDDLRNGCPTNGRSRGVSFSIYGRTNLTGHRTQGYVINQVGGGQTKDWNVDLDETEEEVGGVRTFRIRGTFTLPPKRPEDYELFPGIGYYKFHYDKRLPFLDAYSTCSQEGGHLVIINSQKESEAITALYRKHERKATSMSYIGLYDPKKNRAFTTIFGQGINSTGFTNWYPGEPGDPRYKQFCVYVDSNGLWGDIECLGRFSFFCEYDANWEKKSENN